MVKSIVARSSNKVKAGESVLKELVAVAVSPSSGEQHSGPSILPGSGLDKGVARAQGSPDGGSNPEDVSLTLLSGEISFNILTVIKHLLICQCVCCLYVTGVE